MLFQKARRHESTQLTETLLLADVKVAEGFHPNGMAGEPVSAATRKLRDARTEFTYTEK